jgi:hypothetical protein
MKDVNAPWWRLADHDHDTTTITVTAPPTAADETDLLPPFYD